MESYVLGIVLLAAFSLNVAAVGMMGSAFRHIVLRAGWMATMQPDHASWDQVRGRIVFGAGLGLVAMILYVAIFSIADQLPN